MLNEKRKKMMDDERQAQLDAMADKEAKKSEERSLRVSTNQDANDRELRRKQEADAAHEREREARLAQERREAAARREQEGRDRDTKIRKSQDDETAALEQHR